MYSLYCMVSPLVVSPLPFFACFGNKLGKSCSNLLQLNCAYFFCVVLIESWQRSEISLGGKYYSGRRAKGGKQNLVFGDSLALLEYF